MIEIYTDGACRGNPGPGGWAALLIMGDNEKELNGAEALTTNNRMELTAVIRALEALKRPVSARIFTDSEYVRRGITEWVRDWKRAAGARPTRSRSRTRTCGSSWTGSPRRHQLEWHWVKGHAGCRATNASTAWRMRRSTHFSTALAVNSPAMRQIVLDTETTGLEPELDHRIIEIGCVELVNRRTTGRTFHRYLNPERDIDEGALGGTRHLARGTRRPAALRRGRRGAAGLRAAAPSL